MGDLEFLGRVKMNRLTSLEEDFKESRRQFWQDEADREARRKGLGKVVLETTYERLPQNEDMGNKLSLEDLLKSKQVLPAADLASELGAKIKAQEAFEESVRSEESHRKSKAPTGVGKVAPIYKREPFDS